MTKPFGKIRSPTPSLLYYIKIYKFLWKQHLGNVTWGILSFAFIYLEDDISLIQKELGIVGYTNQEISGLEANKNAIAYLFMFRCSLRQWSRCVNINRG